MNERIKELRKSLNLTMEKFGGRLGVGKTAISKIEKGDNSLTDQMFKGICREFNVSEEWLRTGFGEMFLPDTNEEIEALAKKYNLSHNAQVVIEKFVKLNEADRQVLLSYYLEIAKALAADDVKVDTKPLQSVDISKLSIDEKVELYRRELEREEKAAEKLEASQEGA